MVNFWNPRIEFSNYAPVNLQFNELEEYKKQFDPSYLRKCIKHDKFTYIMTYSYRSNGRKETNGSYGTTNDLYAEWFILSIPPGLFLPYLSCANDQRGGF